MADQVTTSLAQAKVLVMQGLAGKAPRINLTNFHWEVWSNGTQSWVDTGISAVNGAPGADGADGVSPVITVSSITGGHRLTITDAEHPSGQTVDVMNGDDGYTPTISVAQGTNGITVTISDGHPHGTINSYFIPNGQDYVLTNADKQEISNLLIGNVPQLVTDWMDDNISGETTVVIDSSLSVSGAAADAKAAGDAIANSNIAEIKVHAVAQDSENPDLSFSIKAADLVNGEYYNYQNGNIVEGANSSRTQTYYPVVPGSTIRRAIYIGIVYYDINKNYVSGVKLSSTDDNDNTVPNNAYYARFFSPNWTISDTGRWKVKTNKLVSELYIASDTLNVLWDNVRDKNITWDDINGRAPADSAIEKVGQLQRAFDVYDVNAGGGVIRPIRYGETYASNPYKAHSSPVVDPYENDICHIKFWDADMNRIVVPQPTGQNNIIHYAGNNNNNVIIHRQTQFTVVGNVITATHWNYGTTTLELPSVPAYMSIESHWTVGVYTTEVPDGKQYVRYITDTNTGFIEQFSEAIANGIINDSASSDLGRWMRFNAIKEANKKINSLRVASFNIYGAMKHKSNWSSVRNALQNYGIDLIGFQEVYDPLASINSGKFSDSMTSWHLSQFTESAPFSENARVVASTSDFVLVNVTETLYSQKTTSENRYFVKAEFRLPRWKAKNWSDYIKVSVYNTQLDTGKDDFAKTIRLAQAAELVAAMQADTNPFVILTGDFNDFSTDQAVWNYIKNAGFTPMLDDTSTPTSFRGFYDNIFVNDRISIVANDIIPYSDNGTGLSDHDLLLADVVLDYSNVIAVKKVGEHCTISGVEDWLDRRQTETVTVTITPESSYTISEISTGQGDNDLDYSANGAITMNGNTITVRPNLVVGDMWISVTTTAVS